MFNRIPMLKFDCQPLLAQNRLLFAGCSWSQPGNCTSTILDCRLAYIMKPCARNGQFIMVDLNRLSRQKMETNRTRRSKYTEPASPKMTVKLQWIFGPCQIPLSINTEQQISFSRKWSFQVRLGKGRREVSLLSVLAGHVSPWKVLGMSSRK